MSEKWWPDNWRELSIYPWPVDLPRDVYQLDENGDPWNTSWCAENIAPLVFPAGTWAPSPTWRPPGEPIWEPEEPPPEDP